MLKSAKQLALKELRQVPGISKGLSGDLWGLGIRSVRDLKDRNPEKLYQQFCVQKGTSVDRCVLYVFRCAVYYCSNEKHKPNLLKW